MDNDFIDQKIVKARKDCICSLCGDAIKKGQSKWSVAESVDGKINKLDCHAECFNIATQICDSCEKPGCDMSCVDCFKEGAIVISIDEIMDKIKPIFDAFNNICNVNIKEHRCVFCTANNTVVAEVVLDSIFGTNTVYPEKQIIYRDWYKED